MLSDNEIIESALVYNYLKDWKVFANRP